MCLRVLFYLWFFLSAFGAFSEENPPAKETLRNGWFLLDPYQYTVVTEGIESLTGLDVQLVRQAAKFAGKKVTYEPVSWRQHQLDLKEGRRDIASGVTYTDERATYVYYSKPYRYEENSLFVLRESKLSLNFQTVKEMLAEIPKKNFRLGIIDGYVYADPQINEWIAKPAHQPFIVRVGDDAQNLDNLLQGRIDGFLADRIVGATVIWRAGKGKLVTEKRLGIKTPIHFIFSKKSVPLSLVEKFNQAIDEMKKTEEYNTLISWYLQPVFLLQTIDTQWFRIIEYIGTLAFAISGLVIAYRDKATLFGAFVLATLPSLGGGIIRDVIFERRPIGALQTPSNLLLVIGTVLTGFFCLKAYGFYRRRHPREKENYLTLKAGNQKIAEHILMICDGLGLAAFTVTGITVSIMAKVEPLWLWGPFFAFLTGAGGGILRDMISKERIIVSLRGDIYAEIAVLWGFFLSVFLIYQSRSIDPDPLQYAVFLTVIGVFVTRVLVYFFKIPNIMFIRNPHP